jgi:zinc and cadmium transporter
MNTLAYILISTIIVSLIAFVGIFTLTMKQRKLNRILLMLVALSAGGLMGDAFIHLIPEAIEGSSATGAGIFVIAGFSLFFIIERVLHWRHCHEGKCDVHMFTYMNIIGDSVHNFIDGIVIAVSFLVSIPLGIATTIAIIAHEIPQEIGDFAVLVHGGFSRLKALFFNFISALTAVLGAVVGYFISSAANFMPILLAVAAGGFIYISASDLVPELHKEADMKKSFLYFVLFIAGILFMWLIKAVFGQ